MYLRTETAVVLFCAGSIFWSALVLGVWKWQAMASSPDGLAHPYVDIAHRSALLYSFATGLIAVFVEFSGWPAGVNLAAAAVIIALFLATLVNYVRLGIRGDTDNQMRHLRPQMRYVLIVLIVGEIGGFTVLLAGFAAARF
ncbi:hypothetical protein IU510_11570 [Nocardia cyriacigeorgica]|uniref:Integral membrane protein n=2 Tax=Nocardia cyriacigeorgica TaxID=135487 RepID=A0A4U8VZ25_9NOCA|nr:hypothetical protein [Nocardia cyriacigeorgica]MBF6098717.1 hypothetical protein [Nocardia cyriacigeorgica]MBF6163036.1 hypothetical protein [Nocardia cyriacigeorgica]MBF6202004.1 hypothetical protein [Nocardia cyriacigeorgica]MBF6317478.1 hypothetical protein [Nocardia cyriacigeorgica]MBF6345485.1 hypothetical protein [Nocardia cyriacigeorgica]